LVIAEPKSREQMREPELAQASGSLSFAHIGALVFLGRCSRAVLSVSSMSQEILL
jgi:hypothetical protein